MDWSIIYLSFAIELSILSLMLQIQHDFNNSGKREKWA